jgi:hypothetical protein
LPNLRTSSSRILAGRSTSKSGCQS